ncbi:unnamed protein product [Ixodes pacificus]
MIKLAWLQLVTCVKTPQQISQREPDKHVDYNFDSTEYDASTFTQIIC